MDFKSLCDKVLASSNGTDISADDAHKLSETSFKLKESGGGAGVDKQSLKLLMKVLHLQIAASVKEKRLFLDAVAVRSPMISQSPCPGRGPLAPCFFRVKPTHPTRG